MRYSLRALLIAMAVVPLLAWLVVRVWRGDFDEARTFRNSNGPYIHYVRAPQETLETWRTSKHGPRTGYAHWNHGDMSRVLGEWEKLCDCDTGKSRRWRSGGIWCDECGKPWRRVK